MNAFLKAYSASRPFSWVNTAFPFAAGWILVSPTYTWMFAVGVLFFLFPYNLAMYGINDIFDYESDIKNPRKASVEGAQLQKQELQRLWLQIIGWTVPFIAVLIWTGSLWSTIVFLFSLFMVVAYSAIPFRFKEIPFLDSFTSSCHFVTPLLFGILYAGGSLTIHTYIPAIIAYALWGIASHAFGAIQDIVYDREGNIASIATVLGARATLIISTLMYVVSAITIMWSYGNAGIVVGLAVLVYALNKARFYRITDETAHTTNPGWRVFMALNMGLGTLLTTGYIALWKPFAFAIALPLYAPILLSIFVTIVFLRVLKK